MARFLALVFDHRKGLRLQAVRMGALTGLIFAFAGTCSLKADEPMQSVTTAGVGTGATNAPPIAPKPPVAANKPGAPPLVPPPPVPDTFNRYGKIWAPSDDATHPIKLNVQFPGVGEMKIPSQDELNVRAKLEQLATLSDADIRTQLNLWPPYGKMKLMDEGQLLIHIQQFKDQRTKIAMEKAREIGLLNSLTPDQKIRFEKEYWDKQLQMDRELSKQFDPIFKAQEQKLREDLFREFSTSGTVVPPVQAGKPSAVPGPPTNPPVAQNAAH